MATSARASSVRIPDELKQAVQRKAAGEYRTMTDVIVAGLRAYVAEPAHQISARDVVQLTKWNTPHPVGDAIITDWQPYKLPLEGGAMVTTRLWELTWADGSTSWHLRHEFEPIGGDD